MLSRRTGFALLIAAVAAATVGASDVKKDTSLPLIPADAAFYTSSLRLKEQLDAFYNSKAYKALREIPSVKKVYNEAMEKAKEKGGPLEAYEKFLKGKGNKELIEVLTEAVSDEVFILGGKGWVDTLALYQGVNMASSFGMLEEILAGTDPARAQSRAMLVALSKNLELAKIPDLVIGFRLKSAKKAEEQLDRLQKYLNGLELFIEQIKDRVKTKKDKSGKLVMVELDGSQLPLDMIDLSDMERNKGEFDPIIAHLKKMKLTITLGVKGDYLLLSLGAAVAEVDKFGGAGKKLIDRDEIKPILDAGDKKFVSLGYASKEFYEAALGTKFDYAATAKKMKEAVKNSDLKDERKKALSTDIDDLATDLKGMAYQPGAAAGYVHMTEYGFEQVWHDFGKHDALKKVDLKLHQHLGGSPLFAAAFGFAVDGAYIKTMIKWMKKGYTHAEGIMLDRFGDDMADEYKKVMKEIFPRLKKLEDVTVKEFLPALKQSGLGIVIDGKWKSKEWVKGTKFEKELPMAELGLVLGISDAKGFTKAMKEYRLAINDLIGAIRNAIPGGAGGPDISIPPPETEKGDSGNLYWWAIPESVLDSQFRPTIGVGKSAGVVALSKAHAERLIKATALKFRDPALSYKGDVVGVFVLDWVGTVEMVSAWTEHVVMAATLARAEDEGEEGKKKAKVEALRVAKEINTALAVFKAFKGMTSTSRLEDGILVTRTVYVFRDIEGVVEP